MKDLEVFAKTFLTFSEKECKDSSKLYEFLAQKIAGDNNLFEISRAARTGQPVPNLLFGAVQYLLLKGIRHPLQDYYPSIEESPKPHDESFEHFKDFA